MIESQEANKVHADKRPPKAALSFPGKTVRLLVNFLSSIKLAVILLIILASISIIGTVLAQGESAQDNIRFFTNIVWSVYEKAGMVDAASPESVAKYQGMAQAKGLKLYNFSHKISLDRLYNAWYFNLLLVLLSLNLVVCSLKHWPSTWKFFKHPKRVLEGEGAAGIPLRKEIRLKGDLTKTPSLAQEALAFKGYRAGVIKTDRTHHLFAEKGIWGRLGIYVTHLSVLVIFLGAAIGLRYGWKGFAAIEEGTSLNSVNLRGEQGRKELPFSVRCDDFEITYYENTSRPKDYKSQLTVIEGGQEVVKKIIEVNSPLIYKGIYFYQSSYGETGKSGRMKVRVAATDGSKNKEYIVPLSEETTMPEFGLKARVIRFVPDFAMEGNRVFSKSNQAVNPAAAIRLTLSDGRVMSTWIFKNYPNIHSLEGADFTITFAGYEGHQYTGLQVAYDPGVWVIWLGCGLMVIGIFISFFVPHRRLWIKISEGEKGGTAWVAGSTNKNRASFEEEFTDIVDKVKESLAP